MPSEAAARSFARTATRRRPARPRRRFATASAAIVNMTMQKVAYRPGWLMGSSEIPKMDGGLTTVPANPPV